MGIHLSTHFYLNIMSSVSSESNNSVLVIETDSYIIRMPFTKFTVSVSEEKEVGETKEITVIPKNIVSSNEENLKSVPISVVKQENVNSVNSVNEMGDEERKLAIKQKKMEMKEKALQLKIEKEKQAQERKAVKLQQQIEKKKQQELLKQQRELAKLERQRIQQEQKDLRKKTTRRSKRKKERIENAKVQYAEELNQFSKLGFNNKGLNIRMLLKHEGNYTAALSEIQQIALAKQQKVESK